MNVDLANLPVVARGLDGGEVPLRPYDPGQEIAVAPDPRARPRPGAHRISRRSRYAGGAVRGGLRRHRRDRAGRGHRPALAVCAEVRHEGCIARPRAARAAPRRGALELSRSLEGRRLSPLSSVRDVATADLARPRPRDHDDHRRSRDGRRCAGVDARGCADRDGIADGRRARRPRPRIRLAPRAAARSGTSQTTSCSRST